MAKNVVSKRGGYVRRLSDGAQWSTDEGWLKADGTMAAQ